MIYGLNLDAASEILRVSNNLIKGQAETNSLIDQDADISTMEVEKDRVWVPVNEIPNREPSVVELLANGEFGQYID